MSAPRKVPAPANDAGRPTPYTLETQIGHLLRKAYQRHTTIFADLFADEVTSTQWAAIAKLHDVGECSQNLLGRLIGMDVATIKGVVARLTRRELVKVEPDLADRRRLIVALTPSGHDLYARRACTAGQVSADTLGDLTAAERETLLNLMRRLI
jgi:DNA-binding MarR family transcriptional regulator